MRFPSGAVEFAPSIDAEKIHLISLWWRTGEGGAFQRALKVTRLIVGPERADLAEDRLTYIFSKTTDTSSYGWRIGDWLVALQILGTNTVLDLRCHAAAPIFED